MSDVKAEAQEAYREGAENRARGITKTNSHSHIKPTDWNRTNENRRGWDDMNTFMSMAAIYSATRK